MSATTAEPSATTQTRERPVLRVGWRNRGRASASIGERDGEVRELHPILNLKRRAKAFGMRFSMWYTNRSLFTKVVVWLSVCAAVVSGAWYLAFFPAYWAGYAMITYTPWAIETIATASQIIQLVLAVSMTLVAINAIDPYFVPAVNADIEARRAERGEVVEAAAVS